MRTINILDLEEILKGINPTYYINVKIRSTEPFDSNKKYYASFNNANIKEKGCTIGKYGDGMTPDEAIINYCLEISGKEMWFGYSDDCFKIKVPYLFYKT